MFVRATSPMPLTLLAAFCGLSRHCDSSYIGQNRFISTTTPRLAACATKSLSLLKYARSHFEVELVSASRVTGRLAARPGTDEPVGRGRQRVAGDVERAGRL